MKLILSTLLAILMCVAAVPIGFAGFTIVNLVGVVATSQGVPAAGSKIIVKNPSGQVINEATTDSRGRYAVNGLYPGRYQLTLDPRRPEFQGQTVVANLPDKGLTVNWMLLQGAAALATAQPPGAAASRWGDAGIVFLTETAVAGAGGGLAWAFGGFDKNTGRRVSSASQ